MTPPSTRRRVIGALGAAGALGLAGCTTRFVSGSGDPGQTAPTPSETDQPPTTTWNPTGGPDERETATPPGSPALDPSGAWPTYRFDAGNTGFHPEGSGLHDAEPYWRLDAGGPASVAEGTLFNLYSRDRDFTSLTRRDPKTVDVRSATRLVRYGTNHPPTVADGRVFVTTFVEVFCLAADRDEVLWRGPRMDGIQATAAAHDGTVFVNSGGYKGVSPHLRAFDAATGEERWRYDTGSESTSTPAVGSGGVFVNSHDGLHAVEATTGDRRFVIEEAGGASSTPVVSDGTAYAVADRGGPDELFAVDANDGTVRWRFSETTMEIDDAPVVGEGLVYVGTEAGVIALDAGDGSQVAALGVDGSRTLVARVGDVLYTAGVGTIAALDAGGDGELWSHATETVTIEDTVGRGIYGVTPVDDAVYVSARDGFHGLGPATS